MKMSALREGKSSGLFKTVKNRTCKVAKIDNTPNYDIFKENSKYDGKMARTRIKRDNLLSYMCSNSKCILHGVINTMWAGEFLVLHLDHINGVRNDHRIENLRWLCANCHTQTSTYCGRNIN